MDAEEEKKCFAMLDLEEEEETMDDEWWMKKAHVAQRTISHCLTWDTKLNSLL